MLEKSEVFVRFRKAIWVCPECGQEDFTDLHLDGGNTYEHNCSECDTLFNRYKEYNGKLVYTPTEYDALDSTTLASDKKKNADAAWDKFKNPPATPEITKEELEQMKAQAQKQVDELQAQITAKEEQIGD